MNDDVKKLQLKVIAIKERLAQVVADDEERIADLRVQVTLQGERIEELEKMLSQQDKQGDLVEGEVVE